MRRLTLALMLALGMFAVVAGSVLAQSTPQFRVGFATLAALIPDEAGQPLANEQFNSQQGQSLQPTTRGLMVWRKADNATAFTDGETTWILGPLGLQQRPNGFLFAWEQPVMAASLAPPGDPGPDAAVSSALQQLNSVPDGAALVSSATQNRVLILTEPLPRSVLGAFVPEHNLVILSSQLDSTPSKVRADVLAHELQHASDTATMGEPQTPTQCYNFEERAFRKQAQVWTELWGGNLPPNSNPYYTEFNDIALTVANNPQAFVAELVQRYRSECGPLP